MIKVHKIDELNDTPDEFLSWCRPRFANQGCIEQGGASFGSPHSVQPFFANEREDIRYHLGGEILYDCHCSVKAQGREMLGLTWEKEAGGAGGKRRSGTISVFSKRAGDSCGDVKDFLVDKSSS